MTPLNSIPSLEELKLRDMEAESDLEYKRAVRAYMEKHGIKAEKYEARANEILLSSKQADEAASRSNPNAKNVSELRWIRYSPLAMKLSMLEAKPPSVTRFCKILNALTAATLREVSDSRCGELFFTNVFHHGMELLAVLPKALTDGCTSVGGIYFTEAECAKCLDSYKRFRAAGIEAHNAVISTIEKKGRKRRRAKPLSERSEASVLSDLFEKVGKGKYRFTGRHFRQFLKKPRGRVQINIPTEKPTGAYETPKEVALVWAWIEDKCRKNSAKFNRMFDDFNNEMRRVTFIGPALKMMEALASVKKQYEASILAFPEKAEEFKRRLLAVEVEFKNLKARYLDEGYDIDKVLLAQRKRKAVSGKKDKPAEIQREEGGGFPFIELCDPKNETLRMRIKRPNGAEDTATFRIRGEERWHYVLQFAKAKKNRISLTPFRKGKPIDLSLVFRDNKGYNHVSFYRFTRTTGGTKARYWLEQTQQAKKRMR